MEMACWDLIGKATQQPVYNLLGGQVHDKLWAYRYLDMAGVHEQPELPATRATQLIELGISCCQLDPFPSPVPWPRDFPLTEINKAAQIFRFVRDAIDDKLEIGIGTVCAVVLREACTARESRRNGSGRRAHEHAHRDGGTTAHQV